jgi:hypothetical protein
MRASALTQIIVGRTGERTIGPTLTAISYMGRFHGVDRRGTYKGRRFISFRGTGAIEDTLRKGYLW